jgi:hypothetical protein
VPPADRYFKVIRFAANAEGRLGVNVAAFGESGNAIGGAESEGLDGHGGLTAAGGDQAATVTKE